MTDRMTDRRTDTVLIGKEGPPSLLRRTAEAKHRVVILGGGFGGVYTAKELTRRLGKRRDVHVQLLSEENYFVFQPLLPEVAAGGINSRHVVNPIRDLVPGAQFRWCKIIEVDVARKIVRVAQGEYRELIEIPYDHLVFGLGKVTDFSGMPGVGEHSFPMKHLGDAFALRNHVLSCLELADVEDDPIERAALLTFVVAGGGFSGVETVGELSEMLHKCIAPFQNVSLDEVRIVLVHSRQTLLPEMNPKLGDAALRILKRRGIEMVLGVRVRAATRYGVYLSDGRMLSTRTFVCTVGNGANPVVRDTLTRWGFVEGKSNGRGVGVFETDATLACTGRPGYWAVGDCAGVPDPTTDDICPATAQYAIRQGILAAKNILASIDGKRIKPFGFRGLGMLASLGKRSAVADMMGIRFSGFWAWFAWRTVYLSKLPGFVRKLRVAIDWTIDLFFPRDITQIQRPSGSRLRMDHYEPGELIFQKHEIGRELFILKNGVVEAFQPANDGSGDVVLATFKAGEVFGEKALLSDRPRIASVRAVTAVDVLAMTREDFLHLVDEFPVLDAYFDRLMKDRYPAEMPANVPLAAQVAKDVTPPGARAAE